MAYTTINDPSAYFQTAIYTGNGDSDDDTNAITNDGNSDLQPDWVWIKRRDYDNQPVLHDSNRGVTKFLSTDRTDAEGTISPTTKFQSFDTDGFTTGSSSGAYNAENEPFVAWQWKANGGTTSTNTDGDINSTVQVNSTAGFSIVQYNPSNNTARSIGHGLGVQPQVVIVRARDRDENWRVFHRSAGTTGSLILDGTSAYNSSTVLFTADSTSTVFKVGTDFSVNGGYNYIAYCFANVQGYSKFGKYVGNGSANGPFVYTGFKPAFVMIKRADSTSNWQIKDSARNPSNLADKTLFANVTQSEYSTFYFYDLLSNGFKVRGTDAELNDSGGSYIYMAFAENPFVTSTGIPTTAR